jgi:carboxyl-terminal processing protease
VTHVRFYWYSGEDDFPPNSAKQIIVGAPPIAGSAADKAGLKVGDFVTAVNSIPTAGRNVFDIIDQVSETPVRKLYP